jgi:hypothetical protein
MHATLHQAVEKAIATLPKRNVFKSRSGEYGLRKLFPVTSWQPHSDISGKEGSLILGEDACGNLFLYAPDGSVSFWDHETEEQTPLARSVEEFLALLVEPAPVVLKPGQVKSVWIDPEFLAAQRKKGNA